MSVADESVLFSRSLRRQGVYYDHKRIKIFPADDEEHD